MVQIAIPYAYGRTIYVRIYAYGKKNVPYAYGMKYAYGTQHTRISPSSYYSCLEGLR